MREKVAKIMVSSAKDRSNNKKAPKDRRKKIASEMKNKAKWNSSEAAGAMSSAYGKEVNVTAEWILEELDKT